MQWMHCSVYATAFRSRVLDRFISMEESEDWSSYVLIKLFESDTNTYHKYICNYKNENINSMIMYQGYSQLREHTLDYIYNCMLNPDTKVYSFQQRHMDVPFEEIEDFDDDSNGRHSNYL